MPRARITAVIVHWNQPDALVATIDVFRADDACDRVIVVDNGSVDDDGLGLVDSRDGVEIIRLHANLGFGPAANRGWRRWLEHESTEWCALAPHDARPEPGTLSSLLAVGDERPRVGLLSADVGDGTVPLVDHALGPISRPSEVARGYEPADYPHGTLLIARRQCLSEIGLFDERYFAYCEEADLGLRARSAGWEVGIVRGASVVNTTVSTPAPVLDYLMERNTILLVGRHFGRHKAALRLVIGIVELGVQLVRPSRRGEFWSPRARVLALRDAALGRWGPPPDGLRAAPTDVRREPLPVGDA